MTFSSAVKTESEISVLHPGKPRYFNEESTLFSAVNQAIHEQRFQVYAPAKYNNDERDKKRQVREFYTDILDMIRVIANPQPSTTASGGNE